MKTYEGATGDFFVVTPHDTNPLKGPSGTVTTSNSQIVPTRAVYVGGVGNLTVITANGQTVLITAPAVGVFHPIAVTHIKSTGTTATTIIAAF